MTSILTAVAVVAGVGIIIGILLGIAGEKLKVKVDEKEVAVREQLPGNNCGGCGYPGCDGLAAAIAKGEMPASACPVGGDSVASAISKIMGSGEETTTVKKVAFVKCAGDCHAAKDLYEYVGPKDCNLAQNNPGGGPKACSFGCTGYGSCKAVCPFGAIDIENGIAVIDKDKCKACGKCLTVCPRHLIEFVPYDAEHVVRCNSKDKGVNVKKVCSAGCIGCTLCAKNCPEEAISIENNLAHIDQEKCTNCGTCKTKCPVKIIS
jgi:Na+-translocating ferredoxin:NAD+ oxidoreductase RNF subunit RnfB